VGFELPDQIAGARVEASEEAAGVFVQSFTYIDAAIDDGWGAVNFVLRRDLPDFLSGGGAEAIDEAGSAGDIDVGRGDVDAIADDGGRRGEIAGAEGGLAEGPEDFGRGWAVGVIDRAASGLVGSEG